MLWIFIQEHSLNSMIRFPQAKGLGYAMNTAEELKFVKQIAEATGVVLDPVYRFGNSFNFTWYIKNDICACIYIYIYILNSILFSSMCALLASYTVGKQQLACWETWKRTLLNGNLTRYCSYTLAGSSGYLIRLMKWSRW